MMCNRCDKYIIDTFDNGIYHPNVTTIGHGLWIDRYNSYPYLNKVGSERVGANERVFTDQVHPDIIGYYQWADAFYSKIRKFLTGSI